MLPDIYKVMEIGKGTLSVMAKPVSGEWIDEEFSGIAQVGINVIVSLLECDEARECGLHEEQKIAEKFTMEFQHFPIPDRGLPESQLSFLDFTRRLHQQIKQGSNVVIHCRAGIGRTGIVAAGILLHEGYNAERAFELISIKRGVEVPDTQEQVNYLLDAQNALT